MVPLTGYDYLRHPFVAVVGVVSHVILLNVSDFSIVRTIRVLMSNWHTFHAITPLPADHLMIGALDGSAKVYTITNPQANQPVRYERLDDYV